MSPTSTNKTIQIKPPDFTGLLGQVPTLGLLSILPPHPKSFPLQALSYNLLTSLPISFQQVTTAFGALTDALGFKALSYNFSQGYSFPFRSTGSHTSLLTVALEPNSLSDNHTEGSQEIP